MHTPKKEPEELRIEQAIARADSPPDRPPTARELEEKVDALRRTVEAYFKLRRFDPDRISIYGFEEYMGEHPAEYFAKDASDGTIAGDSDESSGSSSFSGPCVLVLFLDVGASIRSEWGDTRLSLEDDLQRLMDRTQFRFEAYSDQEFWFFAREQWLIDAYVRHYEASRPVRGDLRIAEWNTIEEGLLHKRDWSLIGQIVCTDFEFGLIVGESEDAVYVTVLPSSRIPAHESAGYGTQIPLVEPDYIQRSLEGRFFLRGDRRRDERGESYRTKVFSYRPWNGEPLPYDDRPRTEHS